MFWLDQGVTMHPYGTKQNNINKPLYYGNYYHIFSCCIRRKELCGDSCFIRTGTIAKDEIADLINKYAQNENKKTYLLSKADDLFGFAALGEGNETKGVILALPDSMQAPLDSTRWWIFLFVDQQFRHQGIGRSLVMRLYRYAQGKDVIQLTGSATEDDIGFWYKLGFDVYFRGANSKGIMLATAMLRIK